MIPNCHIPAWALTASLARLHRSTILSALGPDYALTEEICIHSFVSGNSHKNFPTGHPSWKCSRANSLNFGVPMKSEASELPKGLVLGRDENIHIRLTRSTPLGDVDRARLHRARHPHRHTFDQGLTLIPNCHIPARAPTPSRARLHHSTILSAFVPDHVLMVFVSGNSYDELPKSLVLGKYDNIHIRLTGSTLIGNKNQSSELARKKVRVGERGPVHSLARGGACYSKKIF
ncbi:unnamed protein product [Malus baccata var. baccata]